MSDKFLLKWAKVRRVVDELVDMGVEDDLLAAFHRTANRRVNSVAELKQSFRTAVTINDQVPWSFYSTIAALIKAAPPVSLARLIDATRIVTAGGDETPFSESLRVNKYGRWQVAWQVDPEAEGAEDKEVALDWYAYPNVESAPIVPVHIMNYVGGCVALLHQNLVLPSAALLLIAFESTLWDALEACGQAHRFSERVTYEPARWIVTRAANKLVVQIEGADKGLSELSEAIPDYPPAFELEARRMQSGEGSARIQFQCAVDAGIAPYLTTGLEKERVMAADRGLLNAIEKGRSENIQCLRTLDAQLDPTLVALRNNLAHLPSPHRLNPVVPLPNGQKIETVEELKQNGRLIQSLVRWIAEVINTAYASQLDEQNA